MRPENKTSLFQNIEIEELLINEFVRCLCYYSQNAFANRGIAETNGS